MKGIVIKSTGSRYDVYNSDNQIISCVLRGKFRLLGCKNTNPLVVGDKVEFVMEDEQTGGIIQIEKRKNYIDRKSTKLSKINHLIASNIDLSFLVVTRKEPRTSLGFIDRFLVACEGFRIPVCLVFNKTDLLNEQETTEVEDIARLYTHIGYETICISAISGQGMEAIREKSRGKSCLFSGHSGVGKSSIINYLHPNLQLKTGEISFYHQKGKHTTTFAQMYPLEEHTFLIDTPGIKEFGLIQYSKDEIRDYFPEIRQYNNCCKFNNCLHVNEPKCSVLQAVKEKKIAQTRYANYLAILHDEDMKTADWELE